MVAQTERRETELKEGGRCTIIGTMIGQWFLSLVIDRWGTRKWRWLCSEAESAWFVLAGRGADLGERLQGDGELWLSPGCGAGRRDVRKRRSDSSCGQPTKRPQEQFYSSLCVSVCLCVSGRESMCVWVTQAFDLWLLFRCFCHMNGIKHRDSCPISYTLSPAITMDLVSSTSFLGNFPVGVVWKWCSSLGLQHG